MTSSTVRSTLVRSTTAAAPAPAATVGEAAVAVTTETPTGAQVEVVAPAVAATGLVVPTAAPEAEEEALEVVATLGAAESPARGAVGRRDINTIRATSTEVTGDTRWDVSTEQAGPAPRRTAARALTSLL